MPEQAEEQTLKGIPVGSVNEYNVGKALERLKLNYDYQYQIMGGRDVRGGQVIDFLVYRVPRPVPVLVQGSYWHGGRRQAETIVKMIFIDDYGEGYWDPVIELLESETETIEGAIEAVRRKIL